MNRIMVIGCPGSGKSTFARNLRDITGLPLYYLDMIWHKSDRTNISREEFDFRLSKIINGDKWIIDGNYNRTLNIRLEKCDTVFLFDLPTSNCMDSVSARIGVKREDTPWIEEEFDEEFKQWIVDFPKRQLPEIYDLLKQYQDKNIIIFKAREDSDAYLKKLRGRIILPCKNPILKGINQ